MPGVVVFRNPISSKGPEGPIPARPARPRVRTAHPPEPPRPAEYFSLKPAGGIPPLRDGDLVVSESHAILGYLAGREGPYPTDIRERVVVDEFPDRFHTGHRAGPAAAAHAMRPTLVPLDGSIASEAAALGRFSVADCALAPVLHRTRGQDSTSPPTRASRRRAGG